MESGTAEARPDGSGPAASGPFVPGSAETAAADPVAAGAAQERDWALDGAQGGMGLVALAARLMSEERMSHPDVLLPYEADDEGTVEEHIAAFEEALAAVQETLAEARALDDAKAKAASGD